MLAIDDGGATFAGVFPELRWASDGADYTYLDGWLTLAVYPASTIPTIADLLQERVLAGQRWEVVPGRVVPVNGTIAVRIDPGLLDGQALNIAATAIANEANPPYGKWGDRSFAQTVAIALEKAEGIYAVPEISLKHALTNIPLSELKIMPWDLFEIQSDVVFQWLRT